MNPRGYNALFLVEVLTNGEWRFSAAFEEPVAAEEDADTLRDEGVRVRVVPISIPKSVKKGWRLT